MKILVVEDDEAVANVLSLLLSSHNYVVEVAVDGQIAWELIEVYDYDLILLDVLLPKLDGISLCQRLRSHGYQMPILLLTGQDNSQNKAIGLDAGADDYIVKPFEQQELLARIRALLRRASFNPAPVLEWGSLQLNPATDEVTYAENLLSLTPKEYALLELFLRNTRRVFSYGAIQDHLWAYEDIPSEDAVRTHIKTLRQKLRKAGAPADSIETVYGIGYRLKPLELKAKNRQLESFSLPSTAKDEPIEQQTLTALSEVWNRFKARVNKQIEILQQAATALMNQALDRELRQHAEQEAHTLSGSLGTFGFLKGSQLANRIERMLQVGESLKQNEIVCLCELVAALRQEVKQSPEESNVDADEEPIDASDPRPLLLVVDRDRSWAEQVVKEAASWGFRGAIASTLVQATTRLEEQIPSIALFDPTIAQPTEDSLTLLVKLNNWTPPIPVLICTAQASLTERLEVARLGGQAFLHKPVTPTQALEAVVQVQQRVEMFRQIGINGGTAVRVMVVDDDPQILAALRTLLEPWGLQVTTLEDPQQFCQTLEATLPDLLILDVGMPNVSGIELCQIVRNDSRWGRLPIIFLTAHTDSSIVNQVFAVGADDFVSKPIVGPELISRILNRLERIQLLRNMTEIDPLTMVYNRQKFVQATSQLLGLAGQQGQPLCLAFLDIDCLKQINDLYSYSTGDIVLRQCGQLLRQTFQQQAVVARWVGEEFVVTLYGATKAEGIERLSRVSRIIRQQWFTSTDRTHRFRVTVSAGIAQYPDDGIDLDSLCPAALAALHQSKLAGCDCIFSAGGTPSSILASS